MVGKYYPKKRPKKKHERRTKIFLKKKNKKGKKKPRIDIKILLKKKNKRKLST